MSNMVEFNNVERCWIDTFKSFGHFFQHGTTKLDAVERVCPGPYIPYSHLISRVLNFVIQNREI